MPDGGFLDQKPRSPTSLLVVVVAHAAVLTALALSKMAPPEIPDYGPIQVKHIPVNPDPPPIPPEPIKEPVTPQHKSVLTTPRPIIKTEPLNDNVVVNEPVTPTIFSNSVVGTVDRPKVDLPPPPPPPKAEPIRIDARMKGGIELLPPYPPTEERAGNEGRVAVRLVIGPDGRVRSVEKISASSEAFWRATERHALRAWRFTPATVDGKPVESSKVITLKFELQG